MPGNCDKSFQPVSPCKMWDQLPFSAGLKRKNPDHGFDPSEPFMDVEDSGFTAECSTKRPCTHEEWQQAVDCQMSQTYVLPATSHMVIDAGRNVTNVRGEVLHNPPRNFQDKAPLVRQRDCIPERQTVFSHDHCRTTDDSPTTSSYIRCFCRPSWEAMTCVLPSGNDYY